MKNLLLIASLLLLPAFGIAQNEAGAVSESDILEHSVGSLESGMWSNPSANKIPDSGAELIQNFFTDVETLAIERDGYQKKDETVLGGGSAVTGLWEFVDNTGQEWIIAYSSRTFYKNIVGDTPVSFGLSSSVDTIPDAAVNLGRIWFVNGTDDLWYFDGTSTGTVPSAPKGRLIEPWRSRIVIAGIGSERSTLRFSEDGDGESWTLGGNPTDPFAITIGGGNDGFLVTCLWSTYIDNLIVGRKRDLWSISGFDQADVERRQISSEIGCLQDGSMREFDGSLLFLSNRGMEEMRGITIQNISEPIRNFTDSIVGNTSNDRRAIVTNQSDFDSGTYSPSGSLSASITSGELQLATATPVASFIDDVDADFTQGNLTNVTISSIPNQVQLDIDSEIRFWNYGGTSNASPAGIDMCVGGYVDGYRQFVLSQFHGDMFLTGVTVRLRATASSIGGLLACDIQTDSGSNSPSGTIIARATNYRDVNRIFGNVDVDHKYLFNQVPLQLGTTYWVHLETIQYADGPRYPCDVGGLTNNHIIWRDTIISDSPFTYYHQAGNPGTPTTPGFLWLEIYSQFHNQTGTFESRVFDLGFDSSTWLHDWETFDSEQSTPANTTLTYQVGSATSASGPFTYTSATPTVKIDSIHNNKRYIRYKASFATDFYERTKTPVLSSATINNGDRLKPEGVFTSDVLDIGSLISSWGPIGIIDSTDAGGNIVYQFNASNSPTIGGFNPGDWESISNGSVPTLPTRQYAAFRATFTATVSTSVASLEEIEISWSEGTASQPVRSWEHDRRYWLSFTTSTESGAFNDTVLAYQRNRTWTILKGINSASFATWRDNLYFGDSSGIGYVYEYGVGNSDDNSSINSIIKFKSYDIGLFNQDKDYKDLYVNFLGRNTGSFSMTYDLDQSGNSYSLGSANMNEGIGQVAAKFPFSLIQPVQGREIQYTINKTGTGDRLKLYDLKTIFSIKEAR